MASEDFKKTYYQPNIKALAFKSDAIMENSGVTGSGNDGTIIDYGGVDDDGSKDPDAKPSLFSTWDY